MKLPYHSTKVAFIFHIINSMFSGTDVIKCTGTYYIVPLKLKQSMSFFLSIHLDYSGFKGQY